MKQINISAISNSDGVKVTNLNTASLVKLADMMRNLTNREYRQVRRITKAYRKADKLYAKYADEQAIVVELRTLSDKELNQSYKLANTLRISDKTLAKAEALEKKMKAMRFEKAQYEQI